MKKRYIILGVLLPILIAVYLFAFMFTAQAFVILVLEPTSSWNDVKESLQGVFIEHQFDYYIGKKLRDGGFWIAFGIPACLTTAMQILLIVSARLRRESRNLFFAFDPMVLQCAVIAFISVGLTLTLVPLVCGAIGTSYDFPGNPDRLEDFFYWIYGPFLTTFLAAAMCARWWRKHHLQFTTARFLKRLWIVSIILLAGSKVTYYWFDESEIYFDYSEFTIWAFCWAVIWLLAYTPLFILFKNRWRNAADLCAQCGHAKGPTPGDNCSECGYAWAEKISG